MPCALSARSSVESPGCGKGLNSHGMVVVGIFFSFLPIVV